MAGPGQHYYGWYVVRLGHIVCTIRRWLTYLGHLWIVPLLHYFMSIYLSHTYTRTPSRTITYQNPFSLIHFCVILTRNYDDEGFGTNWSDWEKKWMCVDWNIGFAFRLLFKNMPYGMERICVRVYMSPVHACCVCVVAIRQFFSRLIILLRLKFIKYINAECTLSMDGIEWDFCHGWLSWLVGHLSFLSNIVVIFWFSLGWWIDWNAHTDCDIRMRRIINWNGWLWLLWRRIC